MAERRTETETSRTAARTRLCRAVSALEKDPFYRSEDTLAPALMPDVLWALARIPHAGRLPVRVITARGICKYVFATTRYTESILRKPKNGRPLTRRLSWKILGVVEYNLPGSGNAPSGNGGTRSDE